MFSRDPFFNSMFGNDPFFSQLDGRPFSNMQPFPSMDQFFQPNFHGGPFAQPAPRRAQRAQPASRVTIEEIKDEDELPRRSSQPTVQEPDEGPHYEYTRPDRQRGYERREHHAPAYARPARPQQRNHELPQQSAPAYARPVQLRQHERSVAMPGPSRHAELGGPSMVSYSSSSSSVSYGGPGGVSYSRTQSAHSGPGGVAEYSESYSDGRRGESSSQHSRFIGNRGRTMQRTCSSNGQDNRQDILHNLENGQASDVFEQDWTGAASQSRPRAHSYASHHALPSRRY